MLHVGVFVPMTRELENTSVIYYFGCAFWAPSVLDLGSLVSPAREALSFGPCHVPGHLSRTTRLDEQLEILHP